MQRLQDIDHVEDLFDRLRLDRTARAAGVCVVEGPSDAGVYEGGTPLGTLKCFALNGRANVLRMADLLELSYLAGVICVADRDFDEEADARAHQWFLIFTDNADLEAMLFFSSALDRVLDEWGSREKVRAAGGVDGVRTLVCEGLVPLSRLRAANAREGLGWRIDAVPLEEILDRRSLVIARVSLADRLARACGAARDDVTAKCAASPGVCPETGAELARGRDLYVGVAVALRGRVGSLSNQQTRNDFVEKTMRLAVRPADLEGTPFVGRLKAAMELAQDAHGAAA